MVDWTKLSLALLGIGYELDVLAIAIYRFSGSSVEAMNVCGFLCYTVALLLLLMMVFGVTPASRGTKIAKICFSFAATVLIVVGVAIFETQSNGKPDPYALTLLITSAIMSLLSGIFCLLTMGGCRC